MNRSCEVLGLRLDPVSLAEAAARVRSFLHDGGAHLVVTANPETVAFAAADKEFRKVVRGADLVVADGVGIVVGARLLGERLPGRVPGFDLFQAVLALAADEGAGVYLLGGRAEVVAVAAREIRRAYPALPLVGYHHGYLGPGEEEKVAAEIAASGARLVFVGMGVPRQEKWLARNMDAAGVRVGMGVGGSFDVLAGRLPRAPAWMRAAGLEWLFRLRREPRRVARMCRWLPRFLLLLGGAFARKALEAVTGRGERGERK